MLTARGDDIDRIVGLDMGADDYVPKPCSPGELVARILREIAVLALADVTLEVGDQRLQILGGEVGVEVNLALVLERLDQMLELALLEIHDDRREHLDETTIAIPREARIRRDLRQRQHALVIKTEI